MKQSVCLKEQAISSTRDSACDLEGLSRYRAWFRNNWVDRTSKADESAKLCVSVDAFCPEQSGCRAKQYVSKPQELLRNRTV